MTRDPMWWTPDGIVEARPAEVPAHLIDGDGDIWLEVAPDRFAPCWVGSAVDPRPVWALSLNLLAAAGLADPGPVERRLVPLDPQSVSQRLLLERVCDADQRRRYPLLAGLAETLEASL